MNNKYSIQYPNNSYNTNLNRYYQNLNHSNSQPNLYSNYKKSPLNLSGQEIISNYYRPNNNNRVSDKLKQDNLIAHKQLNDLTHEYDNMKIFLKDKVNQLEQNQQKQFENLISYLKNNRLEYDERQIKEEISDVFKKQRELKNERFKNFIKDIEKRRINVNIERGKLYEDLYYYNEIQKLNLLHNDLKKHNKNNNYNNQRIPTHNLYQRYNLPYISPPIYLKNNNNEKNKDNELIKLFVLRELMEGNKKSRTHPHIQNIPPTKYKYPQPIIQPIYQPPPPQQPQIQVQTRYIPQPQPIPVPQPIIIQSPPAMPSPNIIIQADGRNETEQLKKLLISPSVTKFSEQKKPTTKKISNQSKRTKTKYMNTEEKEPKQEKKKTEKQP